MALMLGAVYQIRRTGEDVLYSNSDLSPPSEVSSTFFQLNLSFEIKTQHKYCNALGCGEHPASFKRINLNAYGTKGILRIIMILIPCFEI